MGSPHPIKVTSSTCGATGSKYFSHSIWNHVGWNWAEFRPHILQFKLQALVSSKTNRRGMDSKTSFPASASSSFFLLFACRFSVSGRVRRRSNVFARNNFDSFIPLLLSATAPMARFLYSKPLPADCGPAECPCTARNRHACKCPTGRHGPFFPSVPAPSHSVHPR